MEISDSSPLPTLWPWARMPHRGAPRRDTSERRPFALPSSLAPSTRLFPASIRVGTRRGTALRGRRVPRPLNVARPGALMHSAPITVRAALLRPGSVCSAVNQVRSAVDTQESHYRCSAIP